MLIGFIYNKYKKTIDIQEQYDDGELIQKYLAEAKLATCTIGWVVRQDLIERVVQEFKKLYPFIPKIIDNFLFCQVNLGDLDNT